MLQIAFKDGIGPDQVRQIREQVQAECINLKVLPKNSFITLFVVDELSCNIMEHAHATWMDLKIEVDASKFRAIMRDDGVPFDTGAEVVEAKDKKIDGGENDRRLGLSLIGRLVDQISYSRREGVNQVILEKAWAN